MEAVQAFTGQGGWPMTVFLDPEGVPFYGGTYFPPDECRGMPSFRMVMEGGARGLPRASARKSASGRPTMRERLAALVPSSRAPIPAAPSLDRAVANLLAHADPANGGFGRAPKFPPASALELLLTRGGPGAAEHVGRTLDAMLAGGIYDQLGGGFARYAVDSAWLVPHFEKMLYDNGLLARAYLHGWQVLRPRALPAGRRGDARLAAARDARPRGRLLLGLRRRLRGRGGQVLRLDAEEIREVLGDDRAAEIGAYYGVTEGGEPRGRDPRLLRRHRGRATSRATNILHLADGAAAPAPAGLDEARAALLAARAERVRPGLDDKRLTSWNALAIAALAEAGALLGRPDYLEAAEACADFVLDDDATTTATCCAPTRTAAPT